MGAKNSYDTERLLRDGKCTLLLAAPARRRNPSNFNRLVDANKIFVYRAWGARSRLQGRAADAISLRAQMPPSSCKTPCPFGALVTLRVTPSPVTCHAAHVTRYATSLRVTELRKLRR